MNISNIPIEDDPCDVIGKAMRGRGINQQELANQSGLTLEAVSATLNGKINSHYLTKIANCLDLSAKALIELPSYRPDIRIPLGMQIVVSPFGHAGVNSYIIYHNNSAIVFDTGTDISLIFDALETSNLNVAAVVITHTHHDHISGIDSVADTPVLFPEEFTPNKVYKFGSISFTALDVSGHATPARAYYHDGLDTPVCILGDCLFAGSMGGTKNIENYQLAHSTIKENILTLPANTVLGTGHGPVTNLTMELKHNPFIAQL